MLFGGFYKEKSCYSFSIASQQWTKLQNLPSKRYYHSSAIIGNSVFLVGGYKNSTIEEYETVKKKLTKTSKMKWSLVSSTVFCNEFGITVYEVDSLLIAGGNDYAASVNNATNECFVFETKTNSKRYVGSLNTKRLGNVLVNLKSEIFCIGGYNSTDRYLNTIEMFNATTGNWITTDFKLNIGRCRHQAVVHKQFIYVLGGNIGYEEYTNTIERIDVSSGKVVILNVRLKQARSAFAACKANNNFFVFGGEVKDGNSLTSTSSTEVLDLETLEIKEGVELPISNSYFSACSF